MHGGLRHDVAKPQVVEQVEGLKKVGHPRVMDFDPRIQGDVPHIMCCDTVPRPPRCDRGHGGVSGDVEARVEPQLSPDECHPYPVQHHPMFARSMERVASMCTFCYRFIKVCIIGTKSVQSDTKSPLYCIALFTTLPGNTSIDFRAKAHCCPPVRVVGVLGWR